MAESAKLLVDDVLGGYPIRLWVLSLPIPLRLLLARYPKELSKVMQIIHRGKNLMNRWKLMPNIYKNLNINTDLRTYKNIGYEVTDEIKTELLTFFKKHK